MLAVAKVARPDLDQAALSGRWAFRTPLCVAIVITLLNAVKPVYIDDTAYYYYADQAARDPLHPYGFEVFWGQAPVPAMDVLAPPVLPYWWALGIRLFGQDPLAWKLWLFPICLILTTALWSIFRRFARGLETPLVWMTALSPALLPGLNLMLDVPALALNLGALALFFRAVDRRSVGLSILAGVVGGLASQTKYTGLSAAAAMLGYAVFSGRVGLGLIASTVAALVFGSFEGLIALAHGRSHLLSNIGKQTENSKSKWDVLASLPMLLGPLIPVVTLLGMVALRLSRRWIAAVGASVVAAFGVFGLVPRMTRAYRPQVWFWEAHGLLALAVAAVVAWRLTRDVGGESESEPESAPEAADRRPPRSADLFLVFWLILELASYFVLSTFPAVRRTLGVIVALTVLNGALASRTWRGPDRATVLPWLMAGAVGLGGVFYAVDLCEAMTQKQAVEDVANGIGYNSQEPRTPAWFTGHWGFQFYAERAGMKPVVPGRSTVEEGDWLVIPDGGVDQQSITLEEGDVKLVRTITLDRVIPFRTLAGYFSDRSIWGNDKPWIKVDVYRALHDFVPSIPPVKTPGRREEPADLQPAGSSPASRP